MTSRLDEVSVRPPNRGAPATVRRACGWTGCSGSRCAVNNSGAEIRCGCPEGETTRLRKHPKGAATRNSTHRRSVDRLKDFQASSDLLRMNMIITVELLPTALISAFRCACSAERGPGAACSSQDTPAVCRSIDALLLSSYSAHTAPGLDQRWSALSVVSHALRIICFGGPTHA
jgi:hypothetical protein